MVMIGVRVTVKVRVRVTVLRLGFMVLRGLGCLGYMAWG